MVPTFAGARSFWSSLPFLLGMCAAPLLVSGVAHAQSAEEISGARALARQGIEAYGAGDFQRAYDLCQRAESLYHAPPHVLYMARAAAKLGRLVEARELYNKLVRENIASDAPAAFRTAQQEAEVEMKDLEPRLARVTVQLQGEGAEDVIVYANGKVIPAALVGASRPMDPGSYEFTVESALVEGDPVSLRVEEGVDQTVTILLRPSGDSKAPPSTPKVGSTPTVVGPEDHGTGPSRAPAYAALGVGAVGVAVGTIFLVDHLGKKSDAKELFEEGDCGTASACDEERTILEKSSKAATSGTLSIVGYGVGGAALATGLVLLLVQKKGGDTAYDEDNRRHVRPVVGFGSIGLSGRF